MRRGVGHALGLTAVWVLLWGRLSVANVLSGLLASAVLLAVFPLGEREGLGPLTVRPLPVLRLVGYVAVRLVTSNATMTARVLVGSSRAVGTVVACPLRTSADGVVATVTAILALSPGTMVVDIERDGAGAPVVLVHALGRDVVARTRREVATLEDLVVAAIGSAAELAICARPAGAAP